MALNRLSILRQRGRGLSLASASAGLVLLGMISAGVSRAASPPSLLKDLKKRYRQITSLQSDFKEVFTWQLTGETNVREGTLLVAQGDRFRIDTQDQLLIADGKNVYRFSRARKQVIIEPVADSGDKTLPGRLLLNFADQFDAVNSEELVVAERPGFRLDLTARKPDESLLKDAVIWATSEDLTIQRLKLTDLNGNTTIYQLSNIRLNQPVDSSAVSFTPPPEAEIFDLR